MNADEKVAAVIDAIAQAARHRWGEKYLASLVRAYVELEGGDATPKNRRTMVLRALENKSCMSATLFRMAEAVGISIDIRRSL
jgi:hypothetical protein